MPSYYEMSLENKREYVCQNDFSVAEKPLGSWLVVFLDVDWGAQIEKTDHLRDERASDLSKISWNREKREKQWKVEYGQRVASWYHGLKAELSEKHPLLKVLVEQQIRNRLISVNMTDEELQYIDVLDGKREYGTEILISHMSLRKWLGCVKDIFIELQQYQKDLACFLDQVMGDDSGKRGDILNRYAELQYKDWKYRVWVENNYQALSPRFHLSCNHKVYSYTGIAGPVPTGQNLEGHVYMATDSLVALTIWEFDMVCAQEVFLRRCAYCNRYFQPYSVVSCYCDRPVEGKEGKTCKDIGAMSKHQQKVSQDEAKKLYRRVCNRTQMAAHRRKEQHPDILRRYNQVQLYGKELLEQVEEGTMTFEEFQKKFDKKPGELLGVK